MSGRRELARHRAPVAAGTMGIGKAVAAALRSGLRGASIIARPKGGAAMTADGIDEIAGCAGPLFSAENSGYQS